MTKQLTDDELEYIKTLNGILSDLEQGIHDEVKWQRSAINNRLRNPAEPFLSDYELEVKVQFFLSPDFPNYTEEEELIYELVYPYFAFARPAREEPINHPIIKTLPLCYTMNKLFNGAYCGSENDVEQAKFFNIGSIWAELIVQFQRQLEFPSRKPFRLLPKVSQASDPAYLLGHADFYSLWDEDILLDGLGKYFPNISDSVRIYLMSQSAKENPLANITIKIMGKSYGNALSAASRQIVEVALERLNEQLSTPNQGDHTEIPDSLACLETTALNLLITSSDQTTLKAAETLINIVTDTRESVAKSLKQVLYGLIAMEQKETHHLVNRSHLLSVEFLIDKTTSSSLLKDFLIEILESQYNEARQSFVLTCTHTPETCPYTLSALLNIDWHRNRFTPISEWLDNQNIKSKSLTRSIVVLDETNSDRGLQDELNKRDISTIIPHALLNTYDSRVASLSGRILVTTDPTPYIRDAVPANYGIIAIGRHKLIDDIKLAEMISAAITDYRLSERSGGWILYVKPWGLSKLEDLGT